MYIEDFFPPPEYGIMFLVMVGVLMITGVGTVIGSIMVTTDTFIDEAREREIAESMHKH